jgi:hypothetical protein
MASNQLQPYGTWQEIAPGVWTLEGEWYESRFKRRMTAIQTSAGLWIHNPFAMDEAGYRALEALGSPRWIVAPNRMHASDCGVARARFPGAELAVPNALRKKFSGATVLREGHGPTEIEAIEVLGTRWMDEWVFFHRPTGTLIVTDLLFNLDMNVEPPLNAFERRFYLWDEIHEGLAASKIFRWIFLRDRREFRKTFERLLALPVQWVVVNHGLCARAGKKELSRAFKNVFPDL